MIDPKNVFYLETGESAEMQYCNVFSVLQNTEIYSGYVHWLEDKYRQLIDLQTKSHV